MTAVAITRIMQTEQDGLAAIRIALNYSGAQIERETGLTRGIVSAVERGRVYPYPKLRAAVTRFFAEHTDGCFDDLHARLFPGYELPPAEDGEF